MLVCLLGESRKYYYQMDFVFKMMNIEVSPVLDKAIFLLDCFTVILGFQTAL